MTDPSRAVFLSYASEDSEAAGRVAEALKAAGIEVWFDRNALRGGDEWDRKIRREIRDCALFIPLISANSEARHEGYFRLEWDLADQRSHMIVRGRAFIVPVGLDDTKEKEAGVPESFQRVQWLRLPGGKASSTFVDRIRLLLAEHGAAPQRNATAAAPATPPSTSASPPVRKRWSARALGYAAVAVAVLGIAAYVGLRHPRANGAGAAATVHPATVASTMASIAVLPLANLSHDPDQQYFSDGLSESLISALSQMHDLKVIGKTSSFLFRDSKESSHSIGEKLGVARLLEGSVQRSADKIRVTAELIDTADGTTVWSEKYDRPYKDLFALQDEITRAVAEALKAKLLPTATAVAQDERPPSGSLEAYNDYLQGQYHVGRHSEPEYRAAIDNFVKAVAIDPRYALAWSRLSNAQVSMATQYLGGPAAQRMYAQAREAADRALVLAPDLAQAHVAKGNLLLSADFDWRRAEAEFRQALTLAPTNAEAQFQLGALLAALGDVPQAVALTRQALAAEPLRANWYNFLSTYYVGLNRLEEAEQAIRKDLALNNSDDIFEQLVIVQILQHKGAEALATAQQSPAGLWKDLALTFATQVGNDRPAADAALKNLIDKHSEDSAYQIAQAYALRGDAAGTFLWLDRAWTNRDSGINYLLFDPFILRFKDDPRFAAYCRKVGLPVPVQKATGKST